jgi:hypothetical protein
LEVEVVLCHQPPLRAAEAQRETAKAPALVEHRANDAGGNPAIRTAGEDQGFERSRAEGRAWRLQSLIARDTLGYQYTGEGDSSRMPGSEIDDDDIIDRLGRIFKDIRRAPTERGQ